LVSLYHFYAVASYLGAIFDKKTVNCHSRDKGKRGFSMTTVMRLLCAGTWAGTRAKICALLLAAALPVAIASGAGAQQSAPAATSAPASKTHTAATSRHKTAAHRAHHAGAAHSAHVRSAAHKPAARRPAQARLAHRAHAAARPAAASASQISAPATEKPGLTAATEAAPTPAPEQPQTAPVQSAPTAASATEAAAQPSQPVTQPEAAQPPATPTAAAEASITATQQSAAPVPAAEAAQQNTAPAPAPAAEPAPQPAQQAAPAAEAAQQTAAPAQAPTTEPTQPAQQPATPAPATESAQQSPAPAAQNQPAQAAPPTPENAPQPAPATADQNAAQPAAAPDQSAQSAATDQNPQSAAQPSGQSSPAPTTQYAAPTSASLESLPSGPVTEDDLRKILVGKSYYLRGRYLDNDLSFDENGRLTGHAVQGSYTLCIVEIDRVHLTKHKVELEGARYGLHFLGAMPYEDPTKAVDRVKITPKKKFVKMTIDRELVVTPKKKKGKDEQKDAKAGPGGPATPADKGSSESAQPDSAQGSASEPSDADQAKADMASAPPEERPADPGSVTTTTSPAHAAKVLNDALGSIFSAGLDDKMMDTMPDFWKLYYQAVKAKADSRPADPGILRENAVDEKAKLLSKFVPESNDFAQDAGVAGMALYHTVVGADGKPGEISVARPIGFGLDENAVSSIRKATFQPAMKDGKPVPVVLDLVVQFRIYSKRTNVASKPGTEPRDSKLPGLYTVEDERWARIQDSQNQTPPNPNH
jgi:hypothetical protein